jgi:hypothetical protein
MDSKKLDPKNVKKVAELIVESGIDEISCKRCSAAAVGMLVFAKA